MRRDELERAISVGRGVCVDSSRLAAFPHWVREVTILKDLRVVIEFNVFDCDEGGPKYLFRFSEIDALVAALEEYFGKPLTDWENHSATGRYPDPPPDWGGIVDRRENEHFAAAVIAGELPLPRGKWEQLSEYWTAPAASE